MGLSFALSFSVNAVEYTLPQFDDNVHKGVANCTTSSCHGRAAPKPEGELPQNEYRRWVRYDAHAKTYDTLLSDASKAIAKKLNIEDPAKAGICLDCHADNPPENLQGKKFSYDDGVGCESCHGGSERWISSHTAKETPHAENLARGMYPTDDPVARTQLCVSCHLGHPDKIANHKIMGAGHPRLRFEMSAFTENMTPHYVNNQWDIDRGKQTPTDIDLWFLGMLTAAENISAIWQKHLDKGDWAPELSLFDCHSCHHGMSDLQWRPSIYRGNTTPGELRLNTAQLEILASVLSGVGSQDANRFISLIKAAHTNNGNIKKTQRLARELSSILKNVASRYKTQGFTPQAIGAIRKKLVLDASTGNFNSFMLAEQVYLSVETLSILLNDHARLELLLTKVFSTLISEEAYNTEEFEASMKPLLRSL